MKIFRKIVNFSLSKHNEINEHISKKNYKIDQEKKINFIKKKKIIWHFATPKSASTYLMKYLTEASKKNNLGYLRIRALPEHKNRVQEMCINTLYFFLKSSNKEKFLISHIHSPFNDYIKTFFSSNHKIIVQYRDLKSTISSFQDFLDSEARNEVKKKKHFGQLIKFYSPWLNISAQKWLSLHENKKKKMIIYNYIPWHLKFLHSWLNSKTSCHKFFLNYEDVVNNADSIIEKIFETKLEIKKLRFSDESIKFNKGLNRTNIFFNKNEKKEFQNLINFLISIYGINLKSYL